MMLTNKQIKRKEIYKTQQEYIRACGLLKKAQNDFLASLQKCAILECEHANALKKGVAMADFKQILKHYFKVYANVYILREHLDELQNWTAQEPAKYEGIIEQ